MVSPGYAPALRELFRLARLVPCRSESLRERLLAMGCPAEKIRVQRTVIPRYDVPPPTFASDGAWRIVQAGRLVAKKGMLSGLAAFAEFSSTFPRATLTIAGEGPLHGDLVARAEELGIADRVHLVGFLSQRDLGRLFASSHIYLHPSETAAGDIEGVPNALLEAMAHGLPVVSTLHGGIPEAVGGGGILCAEKDVSGLAGALLAIVADRERFAGFSAAARSEVGEKFSGDAAVAQMEAVYREAAGY